MQSSAPEAHSSPHQQEWLEFYSGLCPGPHAGGDTKEGAKNPDYPTQYIRMPQVRAASRPDNWEERVLGFSANWFSPDHHLQSIALHSWWWSCRSSLRTEMRSWKQSRGDGPSTPPFPGLPNQDTSILSLLSGLSRTHHRVRCRMNHRKSKEHSGPASRTTHDLSVSPYPPPTYVSLQVLKPIRTYQTQSSQTSEFRA